MTMKTESLKEYQERKIREDEAEKLKRENEELLLRIKLLTKENSELKKILMEEEKIESPLIEIPSPLRFIRAIRKWDNESMIIQEKEGGKWKIPGYPRLYSLEEIKEDFYIVE